MYVRLSDYHLQVSGLNGWSEFCLGEVVSMETVRLCAVSLLLDMKSEWRRLARAPPTGVAVPLQEESQLLHRCIVGSVVFPSPTKMSQITSCMMSFTVNRIRFFSIKFLRCKSSSMQEWNHKTETPTRTSDWNQVDLYMETNSSQLWADSSLACCDLFYWCLNAESPSSPALVIIYDGFWVKLRSSALTELTAA